MSQSGVGYGGEGDRDLRTAEGPYHGMSHTQWRTSFLIAHLT